MVTLRGLLGPLLQLLGVALIVTGLALIFVPAAFMVGGALLIVLVHAAAANPVAPASPEADA